MTQFIIKDLPKNERPRERFLANGAGSLSLQELLAIILEQGGAKTSVMEISSNLIQIFQDLNGISNASYEKLIEIKGIGNSKAIKILAVAEIAKRIINDKSKYITREPVNSSKTAFEIFLPYYFNAHQEQFLLMTLDSRKRLIAIDKISLGTVNQCLIHPREVFKIAIDRRSSSIIISHNHPSNDSEPSAEDIGITKRLISVSKTMGIFLVDHIILSNIGYFSFKDNNFMSDELNLLDLS